MKTVIKSSMECPMVRRYAQDVVTALGRNLQVHAMIQQGGTEEFGVYADDIPLLQRKTDDLPSIQEVEAVVRRAILIEV